MPDGIFDPEEERRRKLLAMGSDVAEEEDVSPVAALKAQFNGSSARPYSGPPIPNRSPGENDDGPVFNGNLAVDAANPAPAGAPAQRRFAGEGEALEWGRERSLADAIKMAGMIRDRAQAGQPMTEAEVAEAKAAQSRQRATSDLRNLQANMDSGTPEMRAAAQRAWAHRQANPGLAQQEFGPGAAAFVPLEQANKDIERDIQAKQFERGAGIQEKGLSVPVQVAEAKAKGDLAVEDVRRKVAEGAQLTQKDIATLERDTRREQMRSTEGIEGRKLGVEEKKIASERDVGLARAGDERPLRDLQKQRIEEEVTSRAEQNAAKRGGDFQAANRKVEGKLGKDGLKGALASAVQSYGQTTGVRGDAALGQAKKDPAARRRMVAGIAQELVDQGLGLTEEEALLLAKQVFLGS